MNIIYTYIYIYIYIYISFLFFIYSISSREKELTQIRKISADKYSENKVHTLCIQKNLLMNFMSYR